MSTLSLWEATVALSIWNGALVKSCPSHSQDAWLYPGEAKAVNIQVSSIYQKFPLMLKMLSLEDSSLFGQAGGWGWCVQQQWQGCSEQRW